MPAVADEDLVADVDEPPDHIKEKNQEDFHKASIASQATIRKQSLLTQALQNPEPKSTTTEIRLTTDLSRRRSMLSNASIASTAELTSDGGLTSPARTNTPSPPFPSTTYTNFAPYSLGTEPKPDRLALSANFDIKESIPMLPEAISLSPKAQAPVEVAPKKRCITFACGARATPVTQSARPAPQQAQQAQVDAAPLAKRKPMIKFMCPGPKYTDKPSKLDLQTPESSKADTPKKAGGRSPSLTRKSPRFGLSLRSSVNRRSSQSPVAVRIKPKYIVADEATLSSNATRFHEFASGELFEDDWIRKELDHPEKKLTINDTLRKENAIRKLGTEAEAEALEEGEDEDEDEGRESSDNESDEETEGFEDDGIDEDSLEGSDDDNNSDGNETDNEAGFADSDDDDGEYDFWTPHRTDPSKRPAEPIPYRASANDRSVSSNEKVLSASSLDSLHGPSPGRDNETKRIRRKLMKIRPGTPDLPDSTDFVCGTLDEDRPLEDAYVSCLKIRKDMKHKQTPQDIDPSFPTSDIDEEEDEDDDVVQSGRDSDEHVWLHGKFEDSGDERPSRKRSGHRRSPVDSPKRLRSPAPSKRLHSPPPVKTRLRSPPPRKLFGGSPRRIHSPPPARAIRSPPASPTTHTSSAAIAFAPLGSRPGLTHTKSLPRTPNAFCRAYRASRLIAANGTHNADTSDGHVRGAIDIVKGLDMKRQRRKEKCYGKHPRKKGPGKKPQPGKGAERMRELGLFMAGKPGGHDDEQYVLSA
ncbi:hypothetical protein B0O99DRAFT_652054 [Bisporella sp. PMI_857]|nr:hypothetical protein B0O99DRAFT_652054 [Bisporella sp. PMI_857]